MIDRSEGPVEIAMAARHLLESLAKKLWHEAQANARPVVLAGRQDAAEDPFIGAYAYSQHQQGATEPARFHLPEPILQPRDRPRVLIVGANPGYGPGERMPTLEWGLDDYVAFHWDRFDSRGRDHLLPAVELDSSEDAAPKRVIHHLRTVEEVLCPVLGPQPLGRNAVFCDAIP